MLLTASELIGLELLANQPDSDDSNVIHKRKSRAALIFPANNVSCFVFFTDNKLDCCSTADSTVQND